MGAIGSGGIVEIYPPSGGTAGQVLAKVDSQNYNATWVDPGGGGGGAAISAGTSSQNAGTVIFSNSNGVQFGLSAGTLTASVAGAGAPGSISAGTTSAQLGQVVLSNSNNISFGMNGATVTATATFNQTVQTQNSVLVLGSSGNISFQNANGVTFGGNASTITASVAAQTVQTQGSVQVLGSSGNISFGNANGITFGGNASTITASHNGLTSQSNQAFSAAGGSSAFQTLSFANANGATFSNVAGAVQLSYTVPTVPPETPFGISAGTQSVSTGTLAFANSNGITFGMSGSSQITASHNGLTTARASNDAIGLNTAQSNVTWTANSAGLSLDARGYAGTGTSATNASVTLNSLGLAISVAAPGGGGNFSAGVSNLGNTGGDTGVSGTRLVLVGSQNITLNQATDANGLTVSFSGGAGAAGNTGFISAGAATASLGTVVFSNSNGVSFGVNGQTVTASHNGITQQSTQPVAVSGQNGSFAFSTLSFSNANGVSFGTSAGSAITASYTVPSTAGLISAVNVSAGTTSSNVTNFVLSNSNGLSFGLNGATITGSYTVPTVPTSYVSQVNGSSGALSFATGSSLSSSQNGSTVTWGLASNITTALQSANANYLTSQSNQAISGQNGSSTFQTISFANSNGMSFGTSPSGFTASHNGLTTARASNDAVGLNTAQTNVTWTVNSSGISINAAGYAGTATTFNGTNVSGSMTLNSAGLRLDLSAGAGGGGGTLSVYAQSNTTQSSSGTIPASSLQFQGAGIASVGVSNGSIIVSVPSGGGAGDGVVSFGMSTQGNTAGTSGTVSSGRAIIAGTGIISLSQSVNGQSLSLSIGAPDTMSLSVAGILTSGSAGSTITLGVAAGTATMWQPFNEGVNVMGQHGQATMHIAPLPTPAPAALGELQIDRLCLPLYWSNASNSTGSVTISAWMGLYTRNVSSLSLAHSTSYSVGITFSGTSSASLHHGIRLHTVPWTTTINDGRYYVGIISRTTTGGANGTASWALVSQMNSNFSGIFGAASNRSYQWPLGYGYLSASTTQIPSSIAFSQIDGTASLAARPPSWFMINGTA